MICILKLGQAWQKLIKNGVEKDRSESPRWEPSEEDETDDSSSIGGDSYQYHRQTHDYKFLWVMALLALVVFVCWNTNQENRERHCGVGRM